MYLKYIFLIIIVALNAALIWFQANAGFVYEFVKKNELVFILLTSPFIGLLSVYYWKNAVKILESFWSARFLSFSVGIITFTTLTWIILGESPFSLKTISCLILAFLIVIIQVVF